MRARTPPTLRTPLILLAVANLALLGVRLWPWSLVMSLPGNGATAIDPAVSLLGYVGLIPWVVGSLQGAGKKALATASMIGLGAGTLLVVQVAAGAQTATPSVWVEVGLPVAAALLWGIAGIRGARLAGSAGVAMLAGAWSAMVSCLMASTVVLAESFRSNLPPLTTDPWQQYQGLAIGPPATQALVHSLNTVTGFLLIGPILGCVFGLGFTFFEKNKES
jgi:hypothetical protein